jgi:hypothetical protein
MDQSAVGSILRHEDLDEVLAMDWWFEDVRGKVGIDHNEAVKLITNALQPINNSLSTITRNQTEIKGQIQAIRDFEASGWGRARQTILAFGPPAAIVAIFVGMFAITCTAVYQIVSRTKEETAFRGNTDSRLRAIEDKLGIPHPPPLQSAIHPSSSVPIPDQETSALRVFAEMDQGKFSKSLAKVSDAVATAQKRGPTADLSTVDAIRQKLLKTDHGAPSYWNAVAAVVNYRSPADAWESLPLCMEGRATLAPAIGAAVIENCKIQLDGEDAPLVYTMMMRYGLVVFFRHCLVAYRGGHIPLEAAKKLIFVDCRFDVDVHGKEPPLFAKDVMKAIIAMSNPNHVEVPLLAQSRH